MRAIKIESESKWKIENSVRQLEKINDFKFHTWWVVIAVPISTITSLLE